MYKIELSEPYMYIAYRIFTVIISAISIVFCSSPLSLSLVSRSLSLSLFLSPLAISQKYRVPLCREPFREQFKLELYKYKNHQKRVRERDGDSKRDPSLRFEFVHFCTFADSRFPTETQPSVVAKCLDDKKSLKQKLKIIPKLYCTQLNGS